MGVKLRDFVVLTTTLASCALCVPSCGDFGGLVHPDTPSVCCASSCGEEFCGSPHCVDGDGGGDACCRSDILPAGNICGSNGTEAPCNLEASTMEFGPDKYFCVNAMGEDSTTRFEEALFSFEQDKDDKKLTFKCKDGRQEFSCEDDCVARMSFNVSDVHVPSDMTKVTIAFGGASATVTKVKIAIGENVFFDKEASENETVEFDAPKNSRVDMWEMTGVMFLYSITLNTTGMTPAPSTGTVDVPIARQVSESPITYVSVIILVLVVLVASRLYVSCKKTIDKRRGRHGFQELQMNGGEVDEEGDFLDVDEEMDQEYRG